MALIFTDDQVKNISKDILLLPTINASNLAEKGKAEARVANLQETDDQLKVFSDNYIGILEQYFLEKTALNSVVHARYSEQFIQDAVEGNNDHFRIEDPIWVKFPPQVLPENNGNPLGAPTANNEIAQIPLVQAAIDLLKTGYADGVLDDLGATAPAGGFIEVDTGGFQIGEQIVVNKDNKSFLATVDDIDSVAPVTGAERIDYTIIAGAEAGIGVGAQVRNFHPGFNDDEREHVVVPDAPEVRDYWESLIDPEVATHDGFLSDQEDALTANDALGAEATQNSAALTNVQTARGIISTWQAAPGTGDGVGRYGDIVLAPLLAMLGNRTTQAPARVTEIGTSLGNVSQNPADGTFTGAGNFKRLFDFVDLRINFGAGTLSKLKREGQSVALFDSLVQGGQTQLSEYSAKFLVIKFANDNAGNEFIELENVTGLSISDTIKVMDNDSAVLTRTIVDIQGNVVELNSSVPALLVAKLARAVKEL